MDYDFPLGMSWSQLTHIFRRGWVETTKQMVSSTSKLGRLTSGLMDGWLELLAEMRFDCFHGLAVWPFLKHVTLKKIKTMEVFRVLEDLYDLYDPATKRSVVHRISVQFWPWTMSSSGWSRWRLPGESCVQLVVHNSNFTVVLIGDISRVNGFITNL